MTNQSKKKSMTVNVALPNSTVLREMIQNLVHALKDFSVKLDKLQGFNIHAQEVKNFTK